MPWYALVSYGYGAWAYAEAEVQGWQAQLTRIREEMQKAQVSLALGDTCSRGATRCEGAERGWGGVGSASRGVSGKEVTDRLCAYNINRQGAGGRGMSGGEGKGRGGEGRPSKSGACNDRARILTEEGSGAPESPEGPLGLIEELDDGSSIQSGRSRRHPLKNTTTVELATTTDGQDPHASWNIAIIL